MLKLTKSTTSTIKINMSGKIVCPFFCLLFNLWSSKRKCTNERKKEVLFVGCMQQLYKGIYKKAKNGNGAM